MHFRVRIQLSEAFGCVNRWYCSQAYRRQIDDPELLLKYFIRSGGADDFDRRYKEAMGPANHWYCSEFYRLEMQDPQILWDYYMKFRNRKTNTAA